MRALATIPLLGALALTGCGGEARASADARARQASAVRASPEHPVVVELYQSQGCSSCPPANANVNALAERPDVLALSFAVTYWDRLGWKDGFADPSYTARQWDYARAGGRAQVATPQVIVNGGAPIVGSTKAQLDRVVAERGPARGGPALSVAGATLRVAAANPAAASTVWLVRYDPRVREVAIRAGENGGRTLPHRGIVRQLVKLGDWNGRAAAFTLPPAREPKLSTAVLVQRGAGGPITAARML